MKAWFGSAGSTAIPLTNRVGVDEVSMRKKATLAFGLSAFDEMNTRPRLSPTHSVLLSLGARLVATIYPAAPGCLSFPKLVPVRSFPSGTQSPQMGQDVKLSRTNVQAAGRSVDLKPN